MIHRLGTGIAALLALLPSATAAQGGLTGYSSRDVWAAAAACPLTLIDFDSFPDGTVITTNLDPMTIAQVTGTGANLVTPAVQKVMSANTLPFPMFSPSLVPSAPNFFGNDMASPSVAKGEVTIEFIAETTAVGAYVCDSAPLGSMNIDLFDAAGAKIGTISSSGGLSLPSSFIGVVSSTPFKSASFRASSGSDAWGIDDLEFCTPIPCETTAAVVHTPDTTGFNTPQSLAPFPPTNTPFLGNDQFMIAVDDPGDACDLTPGLFTLLAVDFAPGAFVFDRLGCLPDQPGEVMLGFTFQAMFTSPQPWPGPGTPAVHPLPIPALEVLCGAQVFVQGFWIDLVGPSRPAILTQRLDLTLGSP